MANAWDCWNELKHRKHSAWCPAHGKCLINASFGFYYDRVHTQQMLSKEWDK